jgi:hypothetical protein
MTRTDFPRMSSAAGLRWSIFTVVALLAVTVFVFVTDPSSRPYTPFGPLLILGLTVAVLRHRQWLETTSDGVVLVQRKTLSTSRVSLRRARSVALAPNGGGHVQIVAEAPDGLVRANVLALTAYVERSMPPEVLEALADGLQGSRARGAAEVVAALRAQAAHVAKGGSARTSPLASMVVDITGTVGAIGAAGGIGGLID